MHSRPLGASAESSPAKIALYFPRPEIVPNILAGTYRVRTFRIRFFLLVHETRDLSYNSNTCLKQATLTQKSAQYTYTNNKPAVSSPSAWKLPEDDCRAIIESQLLSLRLRSREIVAPPSQSPQNIPPQPRRVYLVGGGSQNAAIAKLAGEILGGEEGVYRLDVGGNACALGSAYKAVWAVERKPRETFEDFISTRWREDEFVEKIADGYQEAFYQLYEKGVDGLEAIEKDVLKKQAIDVGKAGTTGDSAGLTSF